jgi:flagellar protein FlgJ
MFVKSSTNWRYAVDPLAALQHTPVSSPSRADRLYAVAQDMEAAFLAEMLKHAGMGKTSESFGGGQGEDQFASFLTQEHAQRIAQAGGVGLAEQIFKSLSERAEK